jgi:guanylate kinase
MTGAMGSQQKVKMIIVAAPSGAGKSSFLDKICKEDTRLFDTITCTTRKMRQGESQGRPYYFLERSDFEKKVEQGYFIEYAVVHNNLYGTPISQIEEAWQAGKTVIMDVDVQGADTFKAKFPESVTIFIIPPSIEELRRRVTKRDGQIPQDLEVRMRNAELEMKRAKEFDFQIVNDDFEKSYLEFKKIVENLLA